MPPGPRLPPLLIGLALSLSACGDKKAEESPPEASEPILSDEERQERQVQDAALSRRLTDETIAGTAFKIERDPQDLYVVMISHYHDEDSWKRKSPASRAETLAFLWAGAYGFGFRTCLISPPGRPEKAAWHIEGGPFPCRPKSEGMDKTRISRVYYQAYATQRRANKSQGTVKAQSRFRIVEECRFLRAGAAEVDWSKLTLPLDRAPPPEVLDQAKRGVICRTIKGAWSKWHEETTALLKEAAGGSKPL